VFVYDTSKDSDGGAWRKRCQHTSWYNEPLNTATRGARREFPAVALIVAEAAKITIYDADDPALPMWRVEPYAGSSIKALAALNAAIWVATTVGLIFSDYAGDDLGTTEPDYTTETTPAIINNAVNDVAMTVLPDAPIDPATGLPVPTIAVATDGKLSVIKDDGTVWSPSGLGTYEGQNVLSLSADNQVLHSGRVAGYSPVSANLSNNSIFAIAMGTSHSYLRKIDLRNNVFGQVIIDENRQVNVPSYTAGLKQGLAFVDLDRVDFTNSLVAQSTSTYNTGWMNGDIKGAFLSDTDDTDLVGSGELVTNGDFGTDTDWTKGAGWTISGGVAVSDGTASNAISQAGILTVGKTYVVSFDIVSRSAGSVRPQLGTAVGTSVSAVGSYSQTFTSLGNGTFHIFSVSNFNGTIDNVSVKLADADRSINANPLTVNGTITRTPVATGADLVGYSGFSETNYLEGTDATYADTLYALGWEQTAGVWEFKHGVVSAAPIDGLTITGTTLKIAGTKPKALVRVTATTPTAAQLAKIQADERFLFQADAACTLYGASDSVTALAHDPDTGLLHVGTSAGRSVFQGLRRVSNTTTAVGTAISASNGLVVEE